MNITPELVLVGAALLLAGLGLGLWLGRTTSKGSRKSREIERKLDLVLQEKKAYEDEVVEHFTETARLLNKLTDSYRDVHSHLAAGAGSLCQGQGPLALDQLSGGATEPGEIPPELADVRQPLDYAPKSSPDEKGMLNETFGLERESPPGEEQRH